MHLPDVSQMFLAYRLPTELIGGKNSRGGEALCVSAGIEESCGAQKFDPAPI